MNTQLTSEQLFEIFQPLSHWQDRYRQIIQLGKVLPIMPDEQHIIENQIDGCENKAWLSATKNDQLQFMFCGDSEGRIVKGLMGILLILANGKTAEQIAQTDFLAFMRNLNVINELSESRQLGIHHIIERIKFLAK